MEDRGFDGINVIPFIDIMLVLLTIVLTTASFIASGTIPLDLPKARASAAESANQLRVEIDQAGTLYLAGEPTPLAALREHLGARDRQQPVVVRADRAVALQAFVDVMDLLRELGFTRVSLVTETNG